MAKARNFARGLQILSKESKPPKKERRYLAIRFEWNYIKMEGEKKMKLIAAACVGSPLFDNVSSARVQ